MLPLDICSGPREGMRVTLCNRRRACLSYMGRARVGKVCGTMLSTDMFRTAMMMVLRIYRRSF